MAVKAAAEADTPLPLGRCVEEFYRPLARTGERGGREFSVVYEALDQARVDSGMAGPKL